MIKINIRYHFGPIQLAIIMIILIILYNWLIIFRISFVMANDAETGGFQWSDSLRWCSKV